MNEMTVLFVKNFLIALAISTTLSCAFALINETLYYDSYNHFKRTFEHLGVKLIKHKAS